MAKAQITVDLVGLDAVKALVDDLRQERDEARADVAMLLRRVDALQGLLACHRAGLPPTEKLWRELAVTDRGEAEARVRVRLLAERLAGGE